MARRKLSNRTSLKAASLPDPTFRNPLHAVIRFNSACVLAVDVDVDTEQNTVSLVMEDEINNTKKIGACSLSEEE